MKRLIRLKHSDWLERLSVQLRKKLDNIHFEGSKCQDMPAVEMGIN